VQYILEMFDGSQNIIRGSSAFIECEVDDPVPVLARVICEKTA